MASAGSETIHSGREFLHRRTPSAGLGTDAGFYRLIPNRNPFGRRRGNSSRLLKLAGSHNLPVTFRAAGTSLSGQAISDSILIVVANIGKGYSISPDHEEITLQPEVLGQRVNELRLSPSDEIRSDPASVSASL